MEVCVFRNACDCPSLRNGFSTDFKAMLLELGSEQCIVILQVFDLWQNETETIVTG